MAPVSASHNYENSAVSTHPDGTKNENTQAIGELMYKTFVQSGIEPEQIFSQNLNDTTGPPPEGGKSIVETQWFMFLTIFVVLIIVFGGVYLIYKFIRHMRKQEELRRGGEQAQQILDAIFNEA